MTQKIKFILVSLALLFSSICLICSDSVGRDTPCPLMTGHSASLCSMSPLEHVREWQSAFTMTLVSDFLVLVVGLLSFLGAIRVFATKRNILSAFFSSQIKTYFRIFARINISDPLSLAFSQGILNSRAY